MILAAGLGTRLRPLTDNTPKALVNLAGKPLLQHVLERLASFGISEIIVNAHHFKDQISAFVETNKQFGMRVVVSSENELLDTGGGIRKAAWFFDDGQPFVVHNVDVWSDLDLKAMHDFHQQQGGVATVAVRRRKTSRYLLFDDHNRLCGWESVRDADVKLMRQVADVQRFSFMGMQILSPQIFEYMPDHGPFSIIDTYLKLAADQQSVHGFIAQNCRWADLGRPEQLAEIEQEIMNSKF